MGFKPLLWGALATCLINAYRTSPGNACARSSAELNKAENEIILTLWTLLLSAFAHSAKAASAETTSSSSASTARIALKGWHHTIFPDIYGFAASVV
jgi:hypothetical protein